MGLLLSVYVLNFLSLSLYKFTIVCPEFLKLHFRLRKISVKFSKKAPIQAPNPRHWWRSE
jgi:hypothetical protein